MKRLCIVLLLCLLTVSCASQPAPTYTPMPTYTQYPSLTPPPTATRTPEPTATLEPTATKVPAVTPTITQTSEPTATEQPQVGTRQNPVAVGESATITRGDQVYRGYMREVVADQGRVKQMLTEANMFNDVPAEGSRGYLIYFVCEYLRGPEDEPHGMTSMFDFDFLSGTGQFIDPFHVVEPSPAFGGSGYPGATFEGWLFQVGPASDAPDLLVWKEGILANLGEGIFFALQ